MRNKERTPSLWEIWVGEYSIWLKVIMTIVDLTFMWVGLGVGLATGQVATGIIIGAVLSFVPICGGM